MPSTMKTILILVGKTADKHFQTGISDYAGRIGYNEKGQEIFTFGKHNGKLVYEVFKQDLGYYDWMMKGDFPADTKKVLTQIRLKYYNKGLLL